jgi:hypothetical protein
VAECLFSLIYCSYSKNGSLVNISNLSDNEVLQTLARALYRQSQFSYDD